MKNLKFLFGIVFIAAIIFGFTACPDPESDEEFYVQFDSNGGSLVDSQTVTSGGKATEPTNPTAGPNSVPSTQGLYTGTLTFDGWTLDGVDYDFSKPVTSNITLKATWTATPIALPAGANIIAQTVAFLNTAGNVGTSSATTKKYILAVGSDISSAANAAVTTQYYDLTIVGIDTERTITLTGTGSLLIFGRADINSNSANYSFGDRSITIGKNITLKGNASNNNSVVWIRDRARLTMLEGSKVIGNTNSGSTWEEGNGSAVHIDFAGLVVEGGSITGNSGTSTADAVIVGGVYAEDNSSVTLRGGKITGNTGKTTKDLHIVGWTKCNISGTAEVGELTLGYVGIYFAEITVSSNFTGKVDSLNLLGGASTWNGKTILAPATGSTLTQAIIDKFTLATAISATYKIGSDGKLVAK